VPELEDIKKETIEGQSQFVGLLDTNISEVFWRRELMVNEGEK
jgi:hypothetical protein